ncbi:MAG TPA: hypothetical protein VFG19_10840 [Geobacteraceae bacterium]|nr:hypothetical protein [Geobacteraceae bacterium]
MTKSKAILLLLASVFLLPVAGRGPGASAAEKSGTETADKIKEMPLLTGYTWQKMSQDEKVAFVWGMGHVATMEREAAEKYPELKKESFAMKLCSGIAGIPMNRIIENVDGYYRENADKTTEPVIKVIWDRFVVPRLKTESADLPPK